MKVEIFALCDAATDNAGKLNILGTFDTIFSAKMPAIHPACAIAARLRFEKSEEGEHPFRVVIIDEDGATAVPPLEGLMRIRVAPGFESSSSNLVVNFQGLQLMRFGDYRIDLILNNQVAATLPLFNRAIEHRA